MAAKEVEKSKNIFKIIWAKKWLVLIILAVAGVVIWRVSASRKTSDVETTQVQKGTVRDELVLSGEVNADEYASLAFQSSGKLNWIDVAEGDKVTKNQSLAKLDTTGAYEDFQIADANLRAAASTLDRVYDDVKGNENDEDWDTRETRTLAETAKDKSVFSYIKAQNVLANSTLRSPFDGIITYVANPFAGVNILATQPQIEVVNPQTIYFDVTADQSEVSDIKVGQKVAVVVDAFGEEEIEGEVVFVSFAPKSGESGSVYKVKVKFTSNVDVNRLRIGMTGDAKFILDSKDDALYVPTQFLNSDKEGQYVNKSAKNNKVYVESGLENEEYVEIIGDVKEGDTVFD